MTEKVVVIGPALSQTGYGEQCRFALRSLLSRPDLFDVYLKPTNWGSSSWLLPDDKDRQWIDELVVKTANYVRAGVESYDISLQVTIPNEWKKIAPINIGYTAGIETTKVSTKWVENSFLMDKIITVASHGADVYVGTFCEAVNNQTKERVTINPQTPMIPVNYPVRHYNAAPINIDLKHDFNYLAVAQWGPRKNLENTIRWWLEEFQDEEVGLVVKTNLVKTSLIDRFHTKDRLKGLLREFPNRKCKVYLIHGNLSPEEMTSLYQHEQIKCLVSLTHGEGFGLPLFEAAYNGLPIIAPHWSGQTDFLSAPRKIRKNKKLVKKVVPCIAEVKYKLDKIPSEVVWEHVLEADSSWCYPLKDSYQTQLRNVHDNYNRFANMAKDLKQHILKTFTTENQYEMFNNVVSSNPTVKVKKEDLPKVSIITSIYDGDEFIRPFLEDITRQTIFDQCELILINANSPGNEEGVINEYLEKYDNIIYKRLKKDPGIYGVWNKGVKLATGEYITNANLDDRKSPNSLEIHAKSLFTNDDVDLVYADMAITDSPNETFENNSSEGRRYNFPHFSFDNLKMTNMPHASPMWRKSYHDKYGKFDAKYRSAGDWEMWLRGASQGSKFKKIDAVLGLYYFNPTGISTNPENFNWKREEEREVFERYK
jgi:hypothetical protein